MNVIQQTAKIDSTRRVLTLERPLPESVSAGWVNISLFIRPPEPEHPHKIWRGDAPWLREPIETPAPFIPLTREEAHVRQPLR